MAKVRKLMIWLFGVDSDCESSTLNAARDTVIHFNQFTKRFRAL
jgi:hypothetical protein